MRDTRFAFRQAGSWFSFGFVLGACALVSLAAPAARAQANQTSLGDAARKVREEKKNQPAAKSFNNDNLPKTDAGISIVGAPPAEPAAGEEKPAEGAKGTESTKGSEKSAKASADELLSVQHQLDEAVKEKDALMKNIDLAERDFALQQQQAQQNPMFTQDRDAHAHLADLQQGIDDQKASLDKLNEHIAELQHHLDELHSQTGGSGSGSNPSSK